MCTVPYLYFCSTVYCVVMCTSLSSPERSCHTCRRMVRCSRECDRSWYKVSNYWLVCVDREQPMVELVRQSGLNSLDVIGKFSSCTGCSHTACSQNKHVCAIVSSVWLAHDIISDIIIIGSIITWVWLYCTCSTCHTCASADDDDSAKCQVFLMVHVVTLYM